MKVRTLLLTGLIALAVGLALSLQGLREPHRQTAESSPAHRPDSTFTGARLVVMDAAGAPHYRLRTPLMEHYPGETGTDLSTPRMTMLRPDQPPVHLQAKHGWIDAPGSEIRLRDDVHLVREASPVKAGISLRTSKARVWPSKETAQSDRAVTIISDRKRVAGVGMRFDLIHDAVHIRSRARGTYVP